MHSHCIKSEQHQNQQTCDAEGSPCDGLRIESSNDKHRPHIVNDRQSSQKYPCTGWRTWCDQCQCGEGKGNISRNGNTPTPRSKSNRVENPVKRSRDNHAADSARDGKRCFAHRSEERRVGKECRTL